MMRWMDGVKWGVCAGVVMALTACSAPAAPVAGRNSRGIIPLATSKLKAVATFSVIADLVRNVAGDKIELATFVGPDADVHDFEPTPSDLATLADAQLIFENGVALETWLDNLVTSSGTKAERVVLSNGLTLLEAGEEVHDHEEQTAGATETADEHGEHDPHVWQNPQNAMQMVKAIRDALVKADPANAAVYQQNAEAYLVKLEAMEKTIAATLEPLPKESRKLVTSHDALGYFADRFGFEIVGSVIASMSTEAGEPSAQDIVKLVDGIKQTRCKGDLPGEPIQPQTGGARDERSRRCHRA